MDWYALFVASNSEDMVEQQIRACFSPQLLTCFNPKKKVPENRNGLLRIQTKVLFPGYVFIRVELTTQLYYELKRVPKIYRFLNCGKSQSDIADISRIPEEEMIPILQLIGENGILECSDISIIDRKAKVISGPLKSLDAIIKKVDKRKRRAKIELEFLGKRRLIDVGVNILSVD